LKLSAAVVLCSLAPGTAAEETTGWEQKTDESGRTVQQLKIEAPTMTEEDQYGHRMPERYRCDACRAVMFHLDQGFRAKQPKDRRLKAWEYTDVLDETCKNAFSGYGIKSVKGENELTGPGLPKEDISAGHGAIQFTSETWSKRLGEMCRSFVYEELGEEETYDIFYKRYLAEKASPASAEGGLTEALCRNELRQCSASKTAPPKQKNKKGEKEKKAEKEKKNKKLPAKDIKEKKPKTVGVNMDAQMPSSSEKVSVEQFFRSLADKHGLKAEDYVAPRSKSEWEKAIVSIAGRIFSDQKTEL